MNEVQELMTSRLGSKTKVVLASSPGYAGMPPALQFVYAMLILNVEGKGWWMLMATPNRELDRELEGGERATRERMWLQPKNKWNRWHIV